MATAEGEARIVLDPAFRVGAVDRRLFGSFVEHMGRCVYTGVFEPEHPSATPDGFRGDVLALTRELGVGTVRYPGGAFGVFFPRQVFLSLPRELEEAALLDGANQFQIFWRVVVPLARPALATLVVLSFLTNWNDFLWPVYVLFSPSNFTLPAGLSILQGAYTTNYPVIMAGAVVASVPVIILFIAAQRQIVESVARSGLKG